MNFERKWCHECSGIQLFGEHKGKACCSIMSRILKASETGELIRAYMDKETTRNMCRNLGEGCPILFHDYIFHGKADEVRFIRGRLTFTDEDGNPTKDAKGRPCSAPFPSAVVIWRSKDMAQSLRDMVLDLIKDRDMTANEIAATLSDRGQQVNRSDVGPILTKAQAAGLIRNAGKRECSVTGRSAIAWKAEKEVFHGNKQNHKGNPEGEL